MKNNKKKVAKKKVVKKVVKTVEKKKKADKKKVVKVVNVPKVEEPKELSVTEVLLTGLSNQKRRIYKPILENLETHIRVENATPSSLHKLNLPFLPMAFRVLNNLTVMELVGVQPMSGPVGLVYTMEYKEQENSELNPTNGKTLHLSVVPSAVQACSRKLQTGWIIEARQDMNDLHSGLDVEVELISLISNEIADEITASILADLNDISTKTSSIETDPMRIMLRLNMECTSIAVGTRRGPGNFVVMTDSLWQHVQQYVEGTESLKFVMNCGHNNGLLKHVGTIYENLKIYTIPGNDHSALVGYKGGTGETDSGYIYSPYILLLSAGVVMNPQTFQPVISLMTRYGKHVVANADSYYRHIIFLKE